MHRNLFGDLFNFYKFLFWLTVHQEKVLIYNQFDPSFRNIDIGEIVALFYVCLPFGIFRLNLGFHYSS